MQTWKVGLADKNGTQSPLPQLRLRFIWASILTVSIPLFAYAELRHLLDVLPKGVFGAALT